MVSFVYKDMCLHIVENVQKYTEMDSTNIAINYLFSKYGTIKTSKKSVQKINRAYLIEQHKRLLFLLDKINVIACLFFSLL